MKLNMSDVGIGYENENEIWKITDMLNSMLIQLLYKSITEKKSHLNKWNTTYFPLMSRYSSISRRTHISVIASGKLFLSLSS